MASGPASLRASLPRSGERRGSRGPWVPGNCHGTSPKRWQLTRQVMAAELATGSATASCRCHNLSQLQVVNSVSVVNLNGDWHTVPERLQLPELPSSTGTLPRPPVVQDTQAVLKRRRWKQPSFHHLKDRERMYFPGWDTPFPSSQREKLPSHLPPLKSRTKMSQNVVSTPILQNVPISHNSRGQLETSSKLVVAYSKDRYSIPVNKEVDYITSKRLKEEEYYHSKLIRIPFFANFKMWKPFYIWRTKIRAKKFHMARESLQSSLFIVNQSLSPALMDIRKMCYQISDTGLCHMEKKHTYTLQEFQDIQSKQLQEVLNDLRKFQDLVKEVTVCACRNYLTELRAKTIRYEYSTLFAQTKKTFQSSRTFCVIRLVDYLVANTLHILVANAVAKLLAVLQEQVCRTPSHAIVQSWSLSAEVDPTEEEMSQKSETRCGQPMFISELMLDRNALTYKPSEENFQETFAEIIGSFEKTVMSVNTLQADPDLISLIDPGDDEDFEYAYEDSPYLESVIENDDQLQSIIQKIKESFQFAFDAAKVYLHTFERFRLFYKENESLDMDAMRQKDHDVSFLRKALELYHGEHEEATAIQQERQLGLLLVDKTLLKEKLVSSSLRCLEMVTQQARMTVDAVLAEVCEARNELESSISTTAELANFLIFLDEIQERTTVLEAEQETLCQMYSLINMSSVTLPTEDLVVFATLQPSINDLDNIIVDAFLERGSNIDKLRTSLRKDIKELNREVMKIQIKSLDPQLLDISADSSQVHLLLGGIQISIDKLQAQVHVYTSYQKKLKVEVPKFHNLEGLIAEFRLKQLLWDSLEKWNSLSDGWRQSKLEQLDLEQFSTQVTKYSKYINQLEKGLTSNNVVPILKEKVEVMKQRLLVITDLCNPSMEPEHWRTLQSVVGISVNMKELTVAALEKLNVFSYGMKIQEVSEQASGEASVKAIYTKVTDIWLNTNFPVLSHGDSKDGFILGGTDDIQVLLDDSIVDLGLVASSRYVGPIKSLVDNLLEKLTLFNQTLDEWLTCQRNWLYLESIFLAPDIRRQLPAQSQIFFKVDKSWKEIMAKVKLNPNALEAAIQPDLLETFQLNNFILDDIHNYLESKKIFPSSDS